MEHLGLWGRYQLGQDVATAKYKNQYFTIFKIVFYSEMSYMQIICNKQIQFV